MTLWGSRVTFQVSSADPDSTTPVWVDLSDYVLASSPLQPSVGRQNDLEQTDPGTVTVLLKNNDDRFTFGNTSSPYASWWGPGRKCQLVESFTSTDLVIFTGYLQTPTETIAVPGADQTVSVTAIDRLGRLASSKPFIGTLAEHIMYAGGSELKGFWTCCDETAPFPDLQGIQFPLVPRINYPSDWATATSKPSITYQGGASAPGDDLSPVLFATGAGVSDYGYLLDQNSRATIGSFANGEFLTIVFWANFPDPPTGVFTDEILLMGFFNGADFNLLHCSRGSAGITATLLGGTMSASITTSGQPFDTIIPIGIQVGIGPNSLKLWVGDAETTATPSGSPASPQNLSSNQITVGAIGGSIWHFQLYTGSTYNRTKFLAQRDVGNNGNQRQTTGDRIRMLAAYAGLPTADYTDTVDKGTAVMQVADLVDQTPLEAMQAAERTEQGLLYVDGTGRLVFKDRRSLYNI